MTKSSFLDAAARCERLVRTIKERQSGATGRDSFAIDEAGSAPPEQAWSRRFATHVFRAQKSEAGRPPLSVFLAPPSGIPRRPDLPAVESIAPARTAEQGHIGSVLGKAGPRRSWLGRLFRGHRN